jgi:hypothetical protein
LRADGTAESDAVRAQIVEARSAACAWMRWAYEVRADSVANPEGSSRPARGGESDARDDGGGEGGERPAAIDAACARSAAPSRALGWPCASEEARARGTAPLALPRAAADVRADGAPALDGRHELSAAATRLGRAAGPRPLIELAIDARRWSYLGARSRWLSATELELVRRDALALAPSCAGKLRTTGIVIGGVVERGVACDAVSDRRGTSWRTASDCRRAWSDVGDEARSLAAKRSSRSSSPAIVLECALAAWA